MTATATRPATRPANVVETTNSPHVQLRPVPVSAVTLDDTPGLRVASVAPGVIDTEMQAEIRDTTIEHFPDGERFRRMKQEGRLRTPRDAGHEVVEFLMGGDFGREAVTDLRGR